MDWLNTIISSVGIFFASLVGINTPPQPAVPPIQSEVQAIAPKAVQSETQITAPQTSIKKPESSKPPLEKPSQITVSTATTTKPDNTHSLVTEITFSAKPGTPQFHSLALPLFFEGQKQYPVYFWNGSTYVFIKNIEPTEELVFPGGEVSGFKVLIDPSLGWCGGDHILKQISFNTTGTIEVTERIQTTGVEDPICVEREESQH